MRSNCFSFDAVASLPPPPGLPRRSEGLSGLALASVGCLAPPGLVPGEQRIGKLRRCQSFAPLGQAQRGRWSFRLSRLVHPIHRSAGASPAGAGVGVSHHELTAACVSRCILLCFFTAAVLFSVPAPAQQPKPEAKPTEAKPAEEAALADPLVVEQQRVADQFAELRTFLLELKERAARTDAGQADILSDALAAAQKRGVSDSFTRVLEMIRNGQLGGAQQSQVDLERDLQAILQILLTEDRGERNRQQQARIREYLKKIGELIHQQKGIQGRTAGQGEPGKLAEEQARLAGKTGDLAEQIKKNEEGGAQAGQGKPSAGQGKPGSQGKPADKQGKQGEEKPGDKQAKPGEGKPGEGKPGEGKPGEGKPGEGKPGEGKPGEGKPGEGKPGEGKPGEGKPGEGKPGEGKPGEGQGQGQDDQNQGQQNGDESNENPARKRIEAAQQRMRDAEERLRKAEREGARDEQDRALRELEQAKAELEKILRQLREEQIERMLVQLEARLVEMLEMQRKVLERTGQLQKKMADGRSREHEIESESLSRDEIKIEDKANAAMNLLREDGTAVALPEALDQVRDDMRQVTDRLRGVKVDDTTVTVEQDVVSSLEEMIKALRKEMKDREKRKQDGKTPPGNPEDEPLVDILAELKMIRSLQVRVNLRTERYARLLGEQEQADAADTIDALRRLAEKEQRIHKITRDLEMGKNR